MLRWDGVGDQPLVPRRVLADDHGASRDAGMPGEHGGDSAGLDAQAADLDLVVGPPEEFELSARVPAHEVAGAVHAGRGLERTGHEPLAVRPGLRT